MREGCGGARCDCTSDGIWVWEESVNLSYGSLNSTVERQLTSRSRSTSHDCSRSGGYDCAGHSGCHALGIGHGGSRRGWRDGSDRSAFDHQGRMKS